MFFDINVMLWGGFVIELVIVKLWCFFYIGDIGYL